MLQGGKRGDRAKQRSRSGLCQVFLATGWLSLTPGKLAKRGKGLPRRRQKRSA